MPSPSNIVKRLCFITLAFGVHKSQNYGELSVDTMIPGPVFRSHVSFDSNIKMTWYGMVFFDDRLLRKSEDKNTANMYYNIILTKYIIIIIIIRNT